MKTRKNLITLLGVFLALSIIAQTPGINYQAVLRDQAGDPMPGVNVTLFISLVNDTSGDLIYKESHALTTNDLGMLNTLIGTGIVEEGIFEEIVGISDLSMQLQASIPGEPDIVDVGSSKVGSVPFALYGEDADADPDNELQSISSEGDSLIISEMGGVDLNSINYWEKTDTGFVLEIEDFSRSNHENIEITGSNNASGLPSISIPGALTRKFINAYGEKIVSAQNVLKESGLIMNAEEDLSEEEKNSFRENWEQAFLFANLAGSYSLNPFVSQISLANLITLDFYQLRTSGLYQSGMDQNADGCSLFLNYEKRRSATAFLDAVNGGVGLDLYKLRQELFGLGYGVFCYDPPTRTENAATFGGTYSTANDNGLTTLSGAIPGIDPMIPWHILFNGSNPGVTSTINSESAATVSTYGANGQQNTVAGTFAGHPNGGAFLTFNPNGELGAYLWTQTDGSSQIGADQFVMTASPPSRSNDVQAVYSAPMGGEAATYDRGTANLVNGEATIKCPESFQWVADEGSMTVTITPLSADSKGIAVIEKSNGGFKVKELSKGTGNYAFDYLVMCKRKGHEDYQVIRKKPEIIKSQAEQIKAHLPKGPINSMRELGGTSEK